MSDSVIRKLKRKRTAERTKATRFITAKNESTVNTPLDDYEHKRGRLQETLDQVVRLGDAIQYLLEEREYTVNVETCEEYIDSAKRVLLKANQEIGGRLV
jgi:sulfopyruvate decarboxylase TPP-binding subunit